MPDEEYRERSVVGSHIACGGDNLVRRMAAYIMIPASMNEFYQDHHPKSFFHPAAIQRKFKKNDQRFL